jgi:hypothetical protein
MTRQDGHDPRCVGKEVDHRRKERYAVVARASYHLPAHAGRNLRADHRRPRRIPSRARGPLREDARAVPAGLRPEGLRGVRGFAGRVDLGGRPPRSTRPRLAPGPLAPRPDPRPRTRSDPRPRTPGPVIPKPRPRGPVIPIPGMLKSTTWECARENRPRAARSECSRLPSSGARRDVP